MKYNLSPKTTSVMSIYFALMLLAEAILNIFFSLFSFSINNAKLYWSATRQRYEELTMLFIMAKGRKGFGHSMSATKAGNDAKALLVVIVLILLIPAIALVFTGGTTGSTGVYTNSTIANQARNGVFQFSQFIGIAMILGVVGVILALI